MKLSFSNPAIRLVPPNYDRVELCEDLRVEHPLGSYAVTKGFVCDLESVPPLAVAVALVLTLGSIDLSKLGRGAIPGVIHDDLYKRGIVSRAEADAIYLEAMRQTKVWLASRWLKYLVVRLVGWAAWNQHRKNDL